MNTNLSDKYNDGIISQPDISVDLPSIPPTSSRKPTSEQVARAKQKLVWTVIALVGLLTACLVSALIISAAIWGG
jgi:hypothetical protein